MIAHGEAQFWGFLVPFIAGIALRWLPTATSTPDASRGHVGLIYAGLLVGAGGGFVWAVHPLAWLGKASALALVLAAGALASFLLARTVTRLTQPWAVGVAAAGGWLCLWAGFTWRLRAASGMQGPPAFTEAQRAALIELALLGVAVNAVYGFGLRLLPGMVGGKVVSSRAMGAVGLHNGAAAVLLVSTLRAWPAGEAAGLAGVLVATLCFVSALPSLYRPRSFSRRPEQGPWVLAYYVPLALAWLIAGVTLLLAGQVGAL